MPFVFTTEAINANSQHAVGSDTPKCAGLVAEMRLIVPTSRLLVRRVNKPLFAEFE